MGRLSALLRSLVLGLVLVLGLTGCSSSEVRPIPADAVVVDVRTPAEFADGHLQGAVNIDLQSGSFEQAIAELPLDGSYVVYCRSGNRSGQAVSIMTKLGFENLVDAGGLQAASQATGLAIVTGQ